MSTLAMVRLTRRPLNADNPGLTEWINFVRQANTIEHIFGTPDDMGPWWAGGYVEEYPDARIVIDDDSVRIVAKTERGARILRATAAQLNIHMA